jgi:hypothetical protein
MMMIEKHTLCWRTKVSTCVNMSLTSTCTAQTAGASLHTGDSKIWSNQNSAFCQLAKPRPRQPMAQAPELSPANHMPWIGTRCSCVRGPRGSQSRGQTRPGLCIPALARSRSSDTRRAGERCPCVCGCGGGGYRTVGRLVAFGCCAAFNTSCAKTNTGRCYNGQLVFRVCVVHTYGALSAIPCTSSKMQ